MLVIMLPFGEVVVQHRPKEGHEEGIRSSGHKKPVQS
jgi:hypothetical protein